MEFMSGKFPGHSRMGIPLQSRNILVLLEFWHGARSCIKIYSFCRNTTHSHVISISRIISLWYFVLSMLSFIFSEETSPCFHGSPDLHTCWHFYTNLNTLSMIFHILFALNTTMASIVITVKYRLMRMRCVPTEGIYVYA